MNIETLLTAAAGGAVLFALAVLLRPRRECPAEPAACAACASVCALRDHVAHHSSGDVR